MLDDIEEPNGIKGAAAKGAGAIGKVMDEKRAAWDAPRGFQDAWQMTIHPGDVEPEPRQVPANGTSAASELEHSSRRSESQIGKAF